MEYQSFINAGHNETVSNAVEFVGYGSAGDVTESHHPVTVNLSGGSGSGTIQKGSIEVLKVDAEDHSKVLQGATFRLYFDNANRTFVRELQTDANGIARFDNLMLHMPYILEESAAPADYVRSDPYEWQIVLDPTEQDVVMQIENISLKSETLLGELGDYVWLDINRDGLQDEPREKGVNGVNVLLYEKEASGDYKWLETKTTGDEGGDPDRPGTYLFNQLLPATYKVCFERPEGYAFTAAGEGDFEGAKAVDSDAGLGALASVIPAGIDEERVQCSDDIELGLGPKVHTIDAGLLLGRIGDYVWYDVNRDGTQNEPENAGMNGVKVILYKEKDDGSRTFGFADETITSDGADGKPGDYSFEELDPGRYQVCFELPNGYAFTVSGASGAGGTASDSDAGLGTPPAAAGSQVACSDVFELQAGEENLTLDAGLVKGRIGDYVWFDRNGDGTQDEQAKDGFNGVKVELFKKNAQDEFVKIDETVTADKDGDPDRPGYYLFDELDPGEYIVCFEPPSGYVFTQLLRGGDRALDSDADRSTGCSDDIELEAGGEDVTLDAGIVRRTNRGSSFIPLPDESDVPENPDHPREDGDDPQSDNPNDDDSRGNDPHGDDPRGQHEAIDPEQPEEGAGSGTSEPGTPGAGTPGGGTLSSDAPAADTPDAATSDPSANEQDTGNINPPAGQGARDESGGKQPGMLPLTGETGTVWPWIGMLFIVASFGLWLVSNKNKEESN